MSFFRMCFLLPVILFFISCEKDGSSLTGAYHSAEFNLVEKGIFMLQGKSWTIGRKILLKGDSTFRLETCANICTGYWEANNDSVYLFMETNRWRNDSLHEHSFNGRHPQVFDKPIRFLIKRNRWTNDLVLMDKNYLGNRKVIIKLVKTN